MFTIAMYLNSYNRVRYSILNLETGEEWEVGYLKPEHAEHDMIRLENEVAAGEWKELL